MVCIATSGRQLIDGYGRGALVYGTGQVSDGLLRGMIEIHLMLRITGAEPGKGEQIVQQGRHALDTFHDEPSELFGIRVHLRGFDKQLRESANRSERLLQIVRGGVSKRL